MNTRDMKNEPHVAHGKYDFGAKFTLSHVENYYFTCYIDTPTNVKCYLHIKHDVGTFSTCPCHHVKTHIPTFNSICYTENVKWFCTWEMFWNMFNVIIWSCAVSYSWETLFWKENYINLTWKSIFTRDIACETRMKHVLHMENVILVHVNVAYVKLMWNICAPSKTILKKNRTIKMENYLLPHVKITRETPKFGPLKQWFWMFLTISLLFLPGILKIRQFR